MLIPYQLQTVKIAILCIPYQLQTVKIAILCMHFCFDFKPQLFVGIISSQKEYCLEKSLLAVWL